MLDTVAGTFLAFSLKGGYFLHPKPKEQNNDDPSATSFPIFLFTSKCLSLFQSNGWQVSGGKYMWTEMETGDNANHPSLHCSEFTRVSCRRQHSHSHPCFWAKTSGCPEGLVFLLNLKIWSCVLRCHLGKTTVTKSQSLICPFLFRLWWQLR